MVRWLNKIFKIKPQQLTARLNIYPQQNEKKIKIFWSNLTDIPLKNFGKSYIKPNNKHYRKNILYHGTIRIEIPKSINIKHQIYGWTRAVLQDIEPHVKLIQNKWERKTNSKKAINL